MTIDDLLKREGELSSLPEIYVRVADLIDDSSSTAEQIGLIIETDPALSLKMLKTANSAFYGFEHQIDSIRQAVVIMGRNRLKSLLLNMVLERMFHKLPKSQFDQKAYWRHSVMTAILARDLGNKIDQDINSDSLFTAGLLHSIGHLILAHLLPRKMDEILDLTATLNKPLIEAEQLILGFTYTEVGARFIEQWGLPLFLSQTAAIYDEPPIGEQEQLLHYLVYLASKVAADEEIDSVERLLSLLEKLDHWRQTGLNEKQIFEAYEQAQLQLQDALDMLGL